MITGQEIWWIIVVFCGGVGLGGVYFGGLWLTVRRLPRTPGESLLVLVSFLLRLAIVLLGIFWLTRLEWKNVLICLAGLLVARTVIVRSVAAPLAEGRRAEEPPSS